jgi:hypothetical protein
MNADNPDTAKIINNLLSGLMKQGINSVPDKRAQTILQTLKMSVRDNEIVWDADIPEQMVVDFIKMGPTPKKAEAPASNPAKSTPAKRPNRKKRTKQP